MYFRLSLRHNPDKGKSDAYYRLIESYRNETDRVCHRTLLNVGFLDDLVKTVVLALVINAEGFIKYSGIFEGNIQDCKTLEEIIKNLRAKTSTSGRAIVVIDAGIATDENLDMLTMNFISWAPQKI